jgi:hypothetical protein
LAAVQEILPTTSLIFSQVLDFVGQHSWWVKPTHDPCQSRWVT